MNVWNICALRTDTKWISNEWLLLASRAAGVFKLFPFCCDKNGADLKLN
jgi:hypothetical protein